MTQPVARGAGHGRAEVEDRIVARLAEEGTRALASVAARKSPKAPSIERENDHTVPGNPHGLDEGAVRVGKELQGGDEGNQVERASLKRENMAVTDHER